LDKSISEGHDEKLERNIKKKYKEYITAYKKFYKDENYDKEDALNEKMANFGGFSHNAHTLKLITKIEDNTTKKLDIKFKF
jgi:hypothetical protein